MNDQSSPAQWSEVTDLGHGIWAVDTGFKRPLFDASHLVVENGRAAFVDVATSYCVPRLLGALDEQGLAENTLVVFTTDNGPWLPYKLEGGSAGT